MVTNENAIRSLENSENPRAEDMSWEALYCQNQRKALRHDRFSWNHRQFFMLCVGHAMGRRELAVHNGDESESESFPTVIQYSEFNRCLVQIHVIVCDTQ
jgi:hypothetical protein